MPNKLPGGFKLGSAISQAKTYCLMAEDALAKARTVFGIGNGAIQRGAGHAHALRSDANATALKPTQRDFVALAFLTNQVFCRDAAIVKINLGGVAAVLAHFFFQPRHGVTRCVGGHQKGTHTFFASGFISHRNDDCHITFFTTRDELLHAINDVTVARFHRRGLERRRIRAHMRLGQAKRTQQLALCQWLKPFAFLRGIAKIEQDGIDRAVGDADDGAGATVAGRNFFQNQRQAQVIEPRPAILLGHTNAVAAQRGQAFQRLAREVMRFVPRRGVGQHLGLNVFTHGISHLQLV